MVSGFSFLVKDATNPQIVCSVSENLHYLPPENDLERENETLVLPKLLSLSCSRTTLYVMLCINTCGL